MKPTFDDDEDAPLTGEPIKVEILPWLHIQFPGEGLTYARMTRRFGGSRVTMLVHREIMWDDVVYYPTWNLVQGISRVPMWLLLRGIRSRYPETRTLMHDAVDGTWLGESMMQKEKLWSRGLQMLLPLGKLCSPPRIQIEEGIVNLYCQALPWTNAQDTADKALAALQKSGLEGTVELVDEFDTLPWQHILDLVETLEEGPTQLR